jgi:hypothetical protein
MAKELGGNFSDALTPEDFSNILLEMIPSIYQHQNAWPRLVLLTFYKV